MTEYEEKALRITELAREYSRLYNVPDVDEKKAESQLLLTKVRSLPCEDR